MARLVVRITPNPHPDPVLQAQRTQPGDVVCITEDGHQFSKTELLCGHYRIVDLPGVPAVDMMHLMEPVLGLNDVITRRRSLALDLTALTPVMTKIDVTRTVKARL